MSSTTLPKEQRNLLASAVKSARREAEAGAHEALKALAVDQHEPFAHMALDARALRNALRAHGRQLGDARDAKRGTQTINRLAHEVAFEHWHRMLFARFLADNGLLIHPEHGVAVSIADCIDLAKEQGQDPWALAAGFAQASLPQMFRRDDPALRVALPANRRTAIEKLVASLSPEVFTASDSLGWCYQFWQAEKKDEINAAGNKIGADELPAVTQLFTEDYMVDFLLDNTLGAWWAGKVLAANPKLAEHASSEHELRKAVSLPGCPWSYLRFVKGEDGQWTPAAGTFDGWPKTAKELKCLDPCMGSGHFVVAMFERLVVLRMAEEGLEEKAAVAAVIRDNLFGLELDPRCTQIGAFNLALAAWRRVGHCKLPAMNLACSGLAPNTREADWLAIAGDNQKLQRGMERLYRLFQKAAVLGSLINPRAGEGDLLVAAFHELQPLLEKALAQETKDDTAHEMAVTARGLAKAAEILAGQFTLVATNVPYLGRGKQDEVLQDYCERVHPEAKADLATCFVERSMDFCSSGGTFSLVTPQNWLFLTTYNSLRESLLSVVQWDVVALLGPGAFETIGGEAVNVALIAATRTRAADNQTLVGTDVREQRTPAEKAAALAIGAVVGTTHGDLRASPDVRFTLEPKSNIPLLEKFADSLQGISTADNPRLTRLSWERPTLGDGFHFLQGTTKLPLDYAGREQVVRLDELERELEELGGAIRGKAAWGKRAVLVNRMGTFFASAMTGEIFDINVAVILPRKQSDLLPIYALCRSTDFCEMVRKVDPKMNVTNATLGKIPFDLAHWQKVATEKYPHGLPKPFSSDPTQWLFNGHPAGADQPLQVAVARMLGYQWPRQTGSSFPDCPALGPDGLETLADDDGIVPISPAKGEGPAAERLRELLARAYGKDWNAPRQEALLAQVDYAGATLEDWLRNGFFEQHCALFHHRPFIWHVWDGLKNGFSALVNYHKLTHANLEKLTFAYLGDWIRRQQAAVAAEEAGSDAKLQAAKQLQATLKLILEGEPPYDIFVRWKSLAQQPIGWHPDLNDGVRMNIRPFATADILRKRVKIKWDKDRGKEPQRDKAEYPWFWKGSEFTGERLNDIHLTREEKERAGKNA